MATVLKEFEQGIPTEAELFERAKAMIPVLRQRVAECQKMRRVPDETIAEFESAGFFNIIKAKKYGGYELSPTTLFTVLQIIAMGCPSSSWALMVIGVHNYEMCYMDERCSDDVWGQDRTVRISSSYMPFGKVEKVDGGYRISGRWNYSSGADHCEWALLGGFVPNGDGPPEWKAFLIPRTDYEIDQDSWHVFGLAGSGSKDVVLKGEVFVPDYRAHIFAPAAGKLPPPTPAELPVNFRFPLDIVFKFAVASVNLGMAMGAIDVYREQMRTRVSRLNPEQMVKDTPWVGHRLAHAEVKVACAQGLIAKDFGEMRSKIEAGVDLALEYQPTLTYHAAYVGRLAEESVQYLFKAGGARGIANSNLLQMFLRDVQAGTAHIAMDADNSSVVAGCASI